MIKNSENVVIEDEQKKSKTVKEETEVTSESEEDATKGKVVNTTKKVYPSVSMTCKADVLAKLIGVPVSRLSSTLRAEGIKLKYIADFNENFFAEEDSAKVAEDSAEDSVGVSVNDLSEQEKVVLKIIEELVLKNAEGNLKDNMLLFADFDFKSSTAILTDAQYQILKETEKYLSSRLDLYRFCTPVELAYFISSDEIKDLFVSVDNALAGVKCGLFKLSHGDRDTLIKILEDKGSVEQDFLLSHFTVLELAEKFVVKPNEVEKLLKAHGLKAKKSITYYNPNSKYIKGLLSGVTFKDLGSHTLAEIAESEHSSLCQTLELLRKKDECFKSETGKTVKPTLKYLRKYLEENI